MRSCHAFFSPVGIVAAIAGPAGALRPAEAELLAGAMGAQHMVYGDVGQPGTQRMLTLNLFDGSTGRAPGREVIVAAATDELTRRIRPVRFDPAGALLDKAVDRRRHDEDDRDGER